MFVSKVFIAILPIFATAVNAALAPRQSNAPCQYVCPNNDRNGRDLKDSNNGGAGATLTCRYTIPGNRNCVYGRYTGTLINDNDGGDCRNNARNPNNCTGVTKREVEDRKRTFEAVKSKAEAVQQAKEEAEKKKPSQVPRDNEDDEEHTFPPSPVDVAEEMTGQSA